MYWTLNAVASLVPAFLQIAVPVVSEFLRHENQVEVVGFQHVQASTNQLRANSSNRM